MKEKGMLTFDKNELFNDKELHQYDEDGQNSFLGYLLRYEKWEISENKILFPEINTEDDLNKVLLCFNDSVIREALTIKRQGALEAENMGTKNYIQTLDDRVREIDNKKINEESLTELNDEEETEL